jgi:hypothetical protein
VLIISVLLGIATKVFEPTLTGLQQAIYGSSSQPAAKTL